MRRLVVAALCAAVSLVGLGAASAADIGSAKDVAAVRAAWKSEMDTTSEQLVQVVVAGDWAIVETHDKGPNSPFVVLYKRATPDSEQWQDQGLDTGPLAICAFTGHLIPQNIATQLVEGNPRLAAVQKSDPHAGCSGAM